MNDTHHTRTPRVLVYIDSGVPLKRGDVAKTFRGEAAVVEGWAAPRTPESTGRVLLRIEGDPATEYYPSVINAEWRDGGGPQNAAEGEVA